MSNSFPDVDMERTVALAFGADVTTDPSTWTFTDLSTRVLPNPINVRHGVVVGSPNSATSLATVTLGNEDGALTPFLATSPYYPYVDKGTPARFGIRTQPTAYLADTFTRTVASTWGTTENGLTYTYSGGTSFSVNGSQGLISFASANLLRAARAASLSVRDVDITFDVAMGAVAATISTVFGPQVRYVDSSNYLWPCLDFTPGGTVQIQVRSVVATIITFIASNTSTGVTYSAGTLVRCRILVVGDRLRMSVWLAAGSPPAAWQVDVRQQKFNSGGPVGWLGWVPPGNTNTSPYVMTVDNISVAQPRYDRIAGYVSDVRPTYLPVGNGTFYSAVEIDIAGVGSILETRDAPELGPLRRSVEKATPPPIAYWPCEDAEGSTVAVSAFPGQGAMTVTGPATFSFSGDIPTALYQNRFGTKPMISVAAGAKLTGIVPTTAVQSEWAVSFVGEFLVPSISPAVTEMRICEWQTPAGTHNRWALVGTTTGYQVRAYQDSAGTSTNVLTSGTAFSGQQTYTIEANQSGGTINVGLFLNDNSAATGSIAGTLAQPTVIVGNPDRSNVTASILPAGLRFILGQFRVADDTTVRDLPYYTDPDQGGNVIYACNAWFRETVHSRLARQCAEERVPFTLRGRPAGNGLTILNVQQDGSFTSLTTDAAESNSGGLLYELDYGYAWLDRVLRYNRTADLVVDMATYAVTDSGGTEVLQPQLDARLPNVWTVARANGAEVSYAADATFRKRRGTIGARIVLDVYDDDDPREHASWRTHLNVDGRDALYPSLQIDLAANPGLIDSWLACDAGSRVQRINQPSLAGIGTIDQVMGGFSEVIGPRTWQAVADTTPASVWDVAVFDDPVRRQDSASTVTNTSYAPGVTTVVFRTSSIGDVWSTTATPYTCVCSGEEFTVTTMGAVSGTGPYLQTATVVRAANGVSKTLPALEPIHMSTAQLARFAL